MGRIEEALDKAMKKRASEPVPSMEVSEKPAQNIEVGEKPVLSIETDESTVSAPLCDAEVPGAFAVNPRLLTINAPNSVVAEEFRKLKTKVVTLSKQSGFQNSIMVTSALGSEGKSFTSLNLAVSIAQEYDHTVLLVDADLRKPSLHEYLGIPAGPGITDCLTSGIDLSSVITQTGIGKLSLLQAGKAVKNPVELLSSLKMKELLSEMKHRYSDRYLIIDTPPLLPFAETQAVCPLVDGIILVVKQEMTPIQSIKDSLDILKNKRLFGIVYNYVDPESLNSRYNYYYGRYGGDR